MEIQAEASQSLFAQDIFESDTLTKWNTIRRCQAHQTLFSFPTAPLGERLAAGPQCLSKCL